MFGLDVGRLVGRFLPDEDPDNPPPHLCLTDLESARQIDYLFKPSWDERSLDLAIKTGNYALVEWLRQKGLKLCLRSLAKAVESKNDAMYRFILQTGVDPLSNFSPQSYAFFTLMNGVYSRGNITELIYTIINNNRIDLLKELTADPRFDPRQFDRLIIFTAMNISPETLRAVIELGFDPTVNNNNAIRTAACLGFLNLHVQFEGDEDQFKLAARQCQEIVEILAATGRFSEALVLDARRHLQGLPTVDPNFSTIRNDFGF